jgi:hypothetical protein
LSIPEIVSPAIPAGLPASRSTMCPLAQAGFGPTPMFLVKLKANPR